MKSCQDMCKRPASAEAAWDSVGKVYVFKVKINHFKARRQPIKPSEKPLVLQPLPISSRAQHDRKVAQLASQKARPPAFSPER